MKHLSVTILAVFSAIAAAAPVEDAAAGDFSYREGFAQSGFPIINLTKRNEEPSELSKRQSYGGPGYRVLYYCNWGGYLMGGGCREDQPAMGTCYNTPRCFTDDMSSVKLGDQMQCDFFDNVDCRGDQGTLPAYVVKTGSYNLHDYGWGDRIASYRCYPGNPPA